METLGGYPEIPIKVPELVPKKRCQSELSGNVLLALTVDGRNPAPLDAVNIPLFTGVFYIPGGAGFLASTVVGLHKSVVVDIGCNFGSLMVWIFDFCVCSNVNATMHHD